MARAVYQSIDHNQQQDRRCTKVEHYTTTKTQEKTGGGEGWGGGDPGNLKILPC